ncbi:SIMPL domain-containing protein [Sorangium sp. So ce448]|uniref:SIMPL domain-containing protein n=1 Tax=Sorangium sp. So ce448 TaxID=3133314 RepID=UPI003F5DE0ED
MSIDDPTAPPSKALKPRSSVAAGGRITSAAKTPRPTSLATAEVAPPLDHDGWRKVLAIILPKRPALVSVLEHAVLLRFGPERVELGYEENSFLAGQAAEPAARQMLLSALTTYFLSAPELSFTTVSARRGTATFAKLDTQTDSLHLSLQRARRVAPELASATEAVNNALERVEQALSALNLGVTAAVNLDPDANPRDDWNQYVRFGKDGSTWRLLLESGPMDGEPEDWSQSPLLSTSKEVRLRAVDRLPALIDRLVEVAERQVGEFRAAAAKAKALADAIAEAK